MQILREVQTCLDIAAVRPTCAGMTLTGTSARYELLANAELTSENVSGVAQIGTPLTTVTYDTAPDIAYSLGMTLSVADVLTLNLETAEVTGTVIGVKQAELFTVIAASGCTSNGTCNVVVTGANITGSPVTVPVALTTATHTTATLIRTAINTALAANAAVSAQYDITGSSASGTLTDKLYRLNDSTLDVTIPSGLGITGSSSTGSATGVAETKAYRVNGMTWDQTDHEGIPIDTATKLYSVVIRCDSDPGSTVTITAGTTTIEEVSPFELCRFYSVGNNPWNGLDVDFSSDGNVTLHIDIHAGT